MPTSCNNPGFSLGPLSRAVAWLFLSSFAASVAAREADGVEYFEKHIRPVLAERCYECHGDKKQKAALRLDTRAGLEKGGDSGALFTAGKPDESRILHAVRRGDDETAMPPKGKGKPLDARELEHFAAWIAMGAPLPAGATPATDPRQHWAFQPIKRPVATGIDELVDAKLATAGLKRQPPADPRAFIRRASLDVTGLPPTPEEVETFATDALSSPHSALRSLADRLLASPAYGERQARQWLDLARYSDTKGYVYAREERFFVHAWTYRDWVIRALNADMPYDRFIQLQLAADQLVAPRGADLAAMGFLTGGRRFIGVTHEIIDDRIDVVSRGLLALTMQCSRCHDHKFDPLPTSDYYALYGVLRDSAERLVNLTGERPAAFAELDEKYATFLARERAAAAKRFRNRAGDYLAAQLELEKYPEEGFDQIIPESDLFPAVVRRWRDFLIQNPRHRITGAWPRGTADFEINPLVAAAMKPTPTDARDTARRYGELFTRILADAEKAQLADPAAEEIRAFLFYPAGPSAVPDLAITDIELFFPTNIVEELWKSSGKVDRWLVENASAPAHALALFDKPRGPEQRVFKRGSPARLGDPVPRKFPTILGGAPLPTGSGRLDLARAITAPDNPLTARVLVNRIWQSHFGHGLVRTPSDFGTRAAPPSHPELLDWLAAELIASGWSMKAIHRLILTSATYQQATAVPPESDPENRLLSCFPRRRLDFEQMRDAMLSVTGELDHTHGGRPTKLFEKSNRRRTLYGLVDRQFLPSAQRIFDFANPDTHAATRHQTTVPQQALFFMNDEFPAARARALAAAAKGDISTLYRRALQREPSATEAGRAKAFLTTTTADTPPPVPPSDWAHGYGEFDPTAGVLKNFTPLPHFTGDSWQGGLAWPDSELGWARITADGGHPGNTLKHAVIRRWTAPRDANITITSEARHPKKEGDGFRATILHNGKSPLAQATVHNRSHTLNLDGTKVRAGDTIDFVADIGGTLAYDDYFWPVKIATEGGEWDAVKQFTGPPAGPRNPLTPFEQLAQVLLLSNEFHFTD